MNFDSIHFLLPLLIIRQNHTISQWQALACGKETTILPTPVFIRQFLADLECGKPRPLSIFKDKVALLLFLEIVMSARLRWAFQRSRLSAREESA
jgi:hypothetical protein